MEQNYELSPTSLAYIKFSQTFPLLAVAIKKSWEQLMAFWSSLHPFAPMVKSLLPGFNWCLDQEFYISRSFASNSSMPPNWLKFQVQICDISLTWTTRVPLSSCLQLLHARSVPYPLYTLWFQNTPTFTNSGSVSLVYNRNQQLAIDCSSAKLSWRIKLERKQGTMEDKKPSFDFPVETNQGF